MDKVPAYPSQYNDVPTAREMTIEEAALAMSEAASALSGTAQEYAKKAADFLDVRLRLNQAEELLRERQMGLQATRERQGA
jgi:hypothetical protein